MSKTHFKRLSRLRAIVIHPICGVVKLKLLHRAKMSHEAFKRAELHNTLATHEPDQTRRAWRFTLRNRYIERAVQWSLTP